MKNLLSIQGLCKNYGHFQALKDLDVDLQEGTCMGLLGSNGAGKSTTIRIITGQLRPTSGQVRVMGLDPSLEPKKIHPFIGYISDSQTLYEELDVKANIEIFARLYGKTSDRVSAIIARVGLAEKSSEKVKKLSKGLRQRVLIARALVHEPPFIILDEPTTGLDPHSAESIYGILEELKSQGATILLTTHLMNDVDRLCDEVIFINKGVKVEEGTPQNLKKKYSLPTIEVKYLFNGQEREDTIPKSGDWLNKLTEIKAAGEIIRISTHEPKLEDIFIRLLGGES